MTETARCNHVHQQKGRCALPLDHEGPHEWEHDELEREKKEEKE